MRRVSHAPTRNHGKHTIIERFQFITSLFRVDHTLYQWLNTSVIFPPEVICETHGHGGTIRYRSRHLD